jgi:hypothetical protein
MLLYPFPKQSSAFKDHGMREGLELQMILYLFPKQISAFQEHSLREIQRLRMLLYLFPITKFSIEGA